MADLSKLKLNGNEYYFKDAEARLALLNKDIRVFQLYQDENEEWTIGEEETNLMTYVHNSFVVIYYNGKPYFYDIDSDRGARFLSIDGSYMLFMFLSTQNKYEWSFGDEGYVTEYAFSNSIGRLIPYGYCQTAAATVAKEVTVAPEPVGLAAGLMIAVKFQYANTGSNPTLNVNNLGAIAIKRYGTTAPGTSAASNWNANSVVLLTYDGTYWQLTDFNNTTYSGMTDAEYQAGTSTTNRLITPARLKAAIQLWASIPENVSAFTNDAGYLTSYTETDPTVPAWAKAVNKPTYTASEVGALPDTTIIPDISGKVDKAGDTMTGQLIVPCDSSSYVNGGIKFKNSGYSDVTLTAAGGWYDSSYGDSYPRVKFIQGISGKVLIGGILSPKNSDDVANKGYVDDQTAFVKTTAGSDNTEYNLIGTATSNTNTSAVSVYNPGSISFAKTTTEGRLTLGSSSLPGKIRLYSNVTNATGYTDLISGTTSTNTRTITFPDATGTVALTSDIPSVPSWAMQSSKPSYAFSELTSHPTTINDYGITDAYTKTEVDGLVSGVLHYKGAKANTSALPNSGNAIGDVWHITSDGSEWAWDGTEWQELGSTVDLSGYLQTGDIAAWAKASTKPSYTANEVGALPSNTTYVSTFNGQSGAITYIAPVTSVNNQTGVVTITAANISAAASDHAHGNITNAGDITATATIANGDRLVINDESASKIINSSITFGSSTTQYLANDGTWQNVPLEYKVLIGDSNVNATAINEALAHKWPIQGYSSNSGNGQVYFWELTDIGPSQDYSTITYMCFKRLELDTNQHDIAEWTNGSWTYRRDQSDSVLDARITALEQIPWVTYYTGNTTPSNSFGNNGDLYLETN